MKDLLRFLLAIALGLLLFVALDAVSESIFSSVSLHRTTPWHESVLHGALLAAQLVLPAVIAGWITKHHSWLAGALVGAFGVPMVALMSVGSAIDGPVVSVLISGTTRAVITGLVAGIAGSTFRGQPSNNSFKPKPLRGSA